MRRRAWTDWEILAALRADAERKGHPPRQEEWKETGSGRPCARTVWLRFGSFGAGLEAAGLPARGIGGGCSERVWTHEAIVFAMVDWFREHGRWPRSLPDWRRSEPGHPCGTTVHRICGSWSRPLADAKTVHAFQLAGDLLAETEEAKLRREVEGLVAAAFDGPERTPAERLAALIEALQDLQKQVA